MRRKTITIIILVTIMSTIMAFASSAIVSLDEYVTKSEVYSYFSSEASKLQTDVSRIQDLVAQNKIAKKIHDDAQKQSSTAAGE